MSPALTSPKVTLLAGLLLTSLLSGGAASAQDPAAAPSPAGAETNTPPEAVGSQQVGSTEGCLSCHRFPGLGRVDHEDGEIHLYFTSERYYLDAEGPHARLECTQCHSGDGLEKVPHDEVGPVDCTQACHLVTSAGANVHFSHQGVSKRMEASVHSSEAMGELPFAVDPLREGQSSCLYCHDEPVFAALPEGKYAHRGSELTTRCDTCHDEELPVDADYFVQHTAARLEPARPVLQSAQVCAACHSDEALLADMEQHDAVTSYLHSFHGKASLLGSGETATCLDCHAAEDGNAHGMLPGDDATSMTNEANLGLTCRTSGCHPNAAPELTDAAVHLRVDPAARTIEYWLIVAFVALIAFELSTYFGLAILELVNTIVRRHDPVELRRVSLVHAIQETAKGRKLIERMTIGQRIQHWLLVVTFGMLVLTGMPMRFAWHPVSEFIANAMGGIAALRVIHRASGVGMFIVFGFHLLYLGVQAYKLFQEHKAAQPGRSLVLLLKDTALSMPMLPTPTDVKQFTQMYMYLLGLRKERPARGKYHFSQKIEYWAVFWGMGIIGLSGLMMWWTDWVPAVLGGRALNFAIIVHSYEAFLAMMYIVIAHLYAVILAPAAFPLSLAAITGQMPAHEMAENHIGHLESVARSLDIDPEKVHVHHPTLLQSAIKRSYALFLVAPVALLGAWSANYLYDQTMGELPGVEVEKLPLRLDEPTLVAMAEGQATGGTLSGSASDRYQRGPLAHYHQIPTWYRPDAGNTCAGSGCHESLPHGERKEDRAWLNMHSTFVDCQVCHLETQPDKAELRWVSLAQGRAERQAPAVMRLADALKVPLAEDLAERTRQNEALVALLDEAIADAGADPELVDWRQQLTSSRVGGPVHTLYVDQMRRKVHLHGHGEFGAKIGLPGSHASTWAPTEAVRTAAKALREGGANLPEAERTRLIAESHPGLKRPEVQCTRCHADAPEGIDFAALSYSETRTNALLSNTIVRQAEAVEKGEPFYIPSLLPPLPAPPAPEGTQAPAPEEPR